MTQAFRELDEAEKADALGTRIGSKSENCDTSEPLPDIVSGFANGLEAAEPPSADALPVAPAAKPG